jgi:hypothetical protein
VLASAADARARHNVILPYRDHVAGSIVAILRVERGGNILRDLARNIVILFLNLI